MDNIEDKPDDWIIAKVRSHTGDFTVGVNTTTRMLRIRGHEGATHMVTTEVIMTPWSEEIMMRPVASLVADWQMFVPQTKLPPKKLSLYRHILWWFLRGD